MSLQVYPPIVIVRNILDAFFRYRGLTLAPRSLASGGEARAFHDDEIIGDMERFYYVRLDAVRHSPRGARDWVVVLVLGAAGKYAHHSPDLRKLLEGIEAERPAKEGRLDEVIVVAEEEFFGKKNLTDVIREFQGAKHAPAAEAGPGEGADPAGAGPFYSAHPYFVFSNVVPEHKSVYPHRLMAPAEVETYLRRERIGFRDVPVIFLYDAPIVWNGGRENQVVEITRDSQIAGVALYYRRIEPGLYAPPAKKKASS